MVNNISPQCEAKDTRIVATCDQESWVKSRIRTAIRMAFALRSQRRVCADDPAFRAAITGVINGTSVEIIHVLGMKTDYINLWRPEDEEDHANISTIESGATFAQQPQPNSTAVDEGK